MSWYVIRPQIVTFLQNITISDADPTKLLQEVAATPKIRFDGYPAAHVIPSENSSDYETTAENERQYVWTIRVFYETKSGGIQSAFEALEQVVDRILDQLDLEDMKSSANRTIGISLPSTYTYLNMFAVPNRWGDIPDEELIMAEITVKIRMSIDVTS